MMFKILLLLLIYLVLFPFTFFRHDDWLILGNSVSSLSDSWSYAFKPTLYFLDKEINWFFRPFFKSSVYLFYQFFGYHYVWWLVSLWAIFLSALILISRALVRLTDKPHGSLLFLSLVISSVHLHFGSLMWMGEGMMNIFQIFFLSLNLYALSRDFGQTIILRWGALLSYVVSLGFKESSVLHPIFLALFFFIEKGEMAFKKKAEILIPYFLVSAFYLYFRFVHIPMNPHYFPTLNIHKGFVSLGLMLLSLLTPSLILMFFIHQSRPLKTQPFLFMDKKRLLYLFFMMIAVLPYLGQNFFSWGWFLNPGIYFMMILAMSVPELHLSTLRFERLGLTLFAVTSLPIVIYLHLIGFWKWHIGQKEIFNLVSQSMPSQIKTLAIENCENPSYPHSKLERVIGFNASFYEMWKLIHREPVKVSVLNCHEPTLLRPDTLHLTWKFPHFSR